MAGQGGGLQRLRAEGVAGVDVAGLQPLVEPALALRAAAVGEGLRPHDAGLLALQVVVADFLCGVERGFNVAAFQPLFGTPCWKNS